ncbi:MAG: hypothetical protein K6F76_07870 [Clostridiales bacterium]|nr:hypothetical protein [Clostridiales bacterium]
MKFSDKLRLWLQNRYGFDELYLFLSFVCLVFILLSVIPPLRILGIFAAAGICYNTFRFLSKNIEARQKEREFYLKRRDTVKVNFNLLKKRIKDRKTYKYFKCTSCKAVLRVPKGRGKIEVTCPKCKSKFIKKS